MTMTMTLPSFVAHRTVDGGNEVLVRWEDGSYGPFATTRNPQDAAAIATSLNAAVMSDADLQRVTDDALRAEAARRGMTVVDAQRWAQVADQVGGAA